MITDVNENRYWEKIQQGDEGFDVERKLDTAFDKIEADVKQLSLTDIKLDNVSILDTEIYLNNNSNKYLTFDNLDTDAFKTNIVNNVKVLECIRDGVYHFNFNNYATFSGDAEKDIFFILRHQRVNETQNYSLGGLVQIRVAIGDLIMLAAINSNPSLNGNIIFNRPKFNLEVINSNFLCISYFDRPIEIDTITEEEAFII